MKTTHPKKDRRSAFGRLPGGGVLSAESHPGEAGYTAETSWPNSPSVEARGGGRSASAYQHTPVLINPRNDAAVVAVVLRALGFEVIEGLDLDKGAFDRKIRNFSDALTG